MADTNFVSKLTVIAASWLNDVNKAIYRAIGTGAGGTAPQTPADVRTNLGLPSTAGASYIGLTTTLPVTTLQGYTDYLFSSNGALGVGQSGTPHVAAGTVQAWMTLADNGVGWLAVQNAWTAEQDVEYGIPHATQSVDHCGVSGYVHNPVGSTSVDNIIGLRGHAYFDTTSINSPNGIWGIATEAWSNPTNYCTLIGGELSVISQCPTMANPSVGLNTTFKNRLDTATGPTAPIGAGSEYNFNSSALLVTSQTRPTDGVHNNVGSGWQTALRVGDPGFGSGLDWEGGSFFPGSSTVKSYSTIVDMTNALHDLAGGTPWFALYKNAQTYWGMRFYGMLTGALKTYNIKVTAGGAGYVAGDIGNITGGSGTGAQYYVTTVAAGVVTGVVIYGLGGSGYVTTAGAATTATTGVGAGLTIDISIGTGLFYGGNLGIAAGGAGYVVNELVHLNGGAAGYAQPIIKVKTVAAGVVTAFELQTEESILQLATTPQTNTNGRGFTTGNKTTTSITGVGAGLQINIALVQDDTTIGGEKWEFWRMANPGNPTSSGARHGFIDSSFPGTPLTIAAVPYTFPVDRPL